jgi:tRNA A-37 threonylcarbamoyl transferase component Bud32
MADQISFQKLATAGRRPELPLALNLNGNELIIDTWLRTLPGKRYVGRATWRGQTVLAKIYLGKRALTKAGLEVQGSRRLLQAKLPSPEVIHHGQLTDGKAAWVVSRFLPDSCSLEQQIGLQVDSLSLEDEGLPWAVKTAHTIARMHNAGLQQKDIHPGNFLFSDEQCWIIDTADIKALDGHHDRAYNLGVFLSQLPEPWWPGLHAAYQRLADAGLDYGTVCALAWDWQARRAEDLAEKSVRDCSLFETRESWRRFQSCWREDSESLRPLLDDLDGAIARSRILKDGGSATVSEIEWQGRRLVIKRYNLKGLMHRFKRFWRPTRAWHSWQAGHRLRGLGVNTPRPVAMVEERFGALRGRGYLITEHSVGEDLLKVCETAEEPLLHKIANALQGLLQVMERYRISHGDFKATNLLWEQGLVVIDLDAVRWHRSIGSWQKANAKDEARLLRNWAVDSLPRDCIESALTEQEQTLQN